MARPIMAISLTFMGVPGKYALKCRSLVKTVLKKIHPTKFYGPNKKNVRNNGHFWAISFVKFLLKSEPRAISR